MKIRLALCLLAIATLADAAPAHDVCVPAAVGVPTRPGPPAWVQVWDPATYDPVQSIRLDDPRWNNATGHAFGTGAATAAVQTRALWATVGTQKFLYLSFISNLAPNETTNARDVFVGFNRAIPDTANDEFGYIFQFHLSPGGSATAGTLAYCGDAQQAACADNTTTDYWRMYVDRVGAGNGNLGLCSTTNHNGHQFAKWNGADYTKPPIPWMTSATATSGGVAVWKIPASDPAPTQQNQWAIQVRIPIFTNTTGAVISAQSGIEANASFWYNVTEQAATGTFVSIAQWPDLPTSVCVNETTPNTLIHETLLTANDYSNLTSAMPPLTPCDAGFSIKPADIGAVFNMAGPYDTIGLTTNITAYGADGKTAGTNTLVARVENTSTTTTLTAPLMARFRLADWGSAPFGPTAKDNGQWHDIRTAASGVCASGGAPPCAPISIAPGAKKAISFAWQLGSDTTLGKSEYCAYGITPSGGTCSACTCSATNNQPNQGEGCLLTTPPTLATFATGESVCLMQHNSHECLYVELSSPTGAATFVNQSAFNNMNFGSMSTFERDATIDLRQLPKPSHGDKQAVIFMLMPRNMPAKLPAATTGAKLIADRTLEAAKRISESYAGYVGRLTDAEIATQVKRLKRVPMDSEVVKASSLSKEYGEGAILRIEKTFQLMTDADRLRTRSILDVAVAAQRAAHDPEATNPTPKTRVAADLTQNVVTTLGPEIAATVVPTLEVYPFYLPNNLGKMYQPMPSFAVFLSHEGKLDGMHYSIEGATKLAENVYKMEIPVGKTDKIHIRASTEEFKAPEPPHPHPQPSHEPPASPKKKSGCGCETTGNSSTSWLLVGVVIVLLQRRRRR